MCWTYIMWSIINIKSKFTESVRNFVRSVEYSRCSRCMTDVVVSSFCLCSPVAASHTHTVLSPDTDANSLLSRENATAVMLCSSHSNVSLSWP